MKNCLLTPIGNGNYTPPEKALEELAKIPDAPEGLPDEVPEHGPQGPASPVIWHPGMKCIVDAASAENSANKIQDQWIEYWNNINDGRFFASMPDYYQFFKQLKNNIETGNNKDASQAAMQSLREDFEDRWIVTSTRIQYGINPRNSLEGKIVHHYGCNDTSLVKEEIKEIPVYRDEGITKVIQEQKGLEYLQTYFDTGDDAETIVQLMEFISGKKRNKIKVWTADTDARSSPTNRVAALSFDFGEFHVIGGSSLVSGGRARGVRYE